MRAEECRNMSNKYWHLTDEQVKAYERIEHTPYNTPINISECLTDILNAKINYSCKMGKTAIEVNLLSQTKFQGWQIRDMEPYLRWYYMKDGFNFTMYGCDVTIDWSVKE